MNELVQLVEHVPVERLRINRHSCLT
jgi:hypothetical protein